MRKRVIMVTGSAGEIGHALIETLCRRQDTHVLSLDLKPLPAELEGAAIHMVGDILDDSLLGRLVTEYEIDTIFHLAALLSTRAEFTPELAHRVNVEGTLRLLKLAAEQSEWQGRRVRFIFPSSIAAYGLPDLETKERDSHVREWDWNTPTTMYGCNKLTCEHLGRYFTFHYQQLAKERPKSGVDFRGLRFPGLLSAETLPTGGTSDYAPEMVHHAAKGEPYACFVDEEAVIPFMAMPDAIRTMTMLADADAGQLTRRVYNVGAFSLTGAEIRTHVLESFPSADVTFERDEPRARIVDSWPADVDDSAARADWGWQHEYDATRMFRDYLVPGVKAHYGLV